MFSPLRRPDGYQHHAADTPATPTGSSSPFNALSPIANAVRHATKEGTRDWERMFGSFSQWTQSYSPRNQERQTPNRLHKRQAHEDTLAAADSTSSTSLTPDLERHSIAANSIGTSSSARYRERPPVQYRESLFGSPRRSVVSAAASTPSLDRSSLPPPSLTPSSTQSASILEDAATQHSRRYYNDDDDNDEQHVATAYRSPSRSISSTTYRSPYFAQQKPRRSQRVSSIKRYTPTHSPQRHAALDDEIYRLDQLQRRLDTIQQVSSELADESRDAANEIRSFKRTSPSVDIASKHRRVSGHDYSASRRLSSRRSIIRNPSFARSRLEGEDNSDSCPPTSAPSPLRTTPAPPPPPPPPPPPGPPGTASAAPRRSYASVAAQRTPLTRQTPNSCKAFSTTPRDPETPSRLMRNVLTDITKAKLRSTATYRRASGTNIRNPFWEEIQAAKAQEKGSPSLKNRSSPLRKPTPARSNAAFSATSTPQPMYWESDHDGGVDDYWPRPRRITEKLMSLAQEDREEREAAATAQIGTPGSLGDELEQAMRKSDLEARRRARAKAESLAFSLDPLDDMPHQGDDNAIDRNDQRLSQNGIQCIDGDEWMFDGRQYIVNEKKK